MGIPETDCGASKEPRHLVLMLTEACNLRCVYCYRGDRRCARSMHREVAERSLQYIVSWGHHFHVQITGGEPTLEPTLIEWIAALGWCRKSGREDRGEDPPKSSPPCLPALHEEPENGGPGLFQADRFTGIFMLSPGLLDVNNQS